MGKRRRSPAGKAKGLFGRIFFQPVGRYQCEIIKVDNAIALSFRSGHIRTVTLIKKITKINCPPLGDPKHILYPHSAVTICVAGNTNRSRNPNG